MHDIHYGPAPPLVVALPQALVGVAFSGLFREAGFRVVGSYADVEAPIDSVERSRPDLVLIDPPIEEHEGRSSTLARLCDVQVATKVVVLAAMADAALAPAQALLRYWLLPGSPREQAPAAVIVDSFRFAKNSPKRSHVT